MPLKLKRYVVLLLALFLINIPIEKQGVVIPADIYYKKGANTMFIQMEKLAVMNYVSDRS